MWHNERLAAGSAEALARQRAEAAELVRLRRENKRLKQKNETFRRDADFLPGSDIAEVRRLVLLRPLEVAGPH
jgi:hypothetical protein